MTMNLVAIAGMPESEPRLISCGPPFGEVPATDDDRQTMWMSLAAFGLAAVAGYYLGERLL